MRIAALGFIAALGLLATAASANSASLAANGSAAVIPVAGGCGFGFHPTPFGDCVPYRHHRRFVRPHRGDDYVVDEWDEYDEY